jgi:hypothetical protein
MAFVLSLWDMLGIGQELRFHVCPTAVCMASVKARRVERIVPSSKP